MTDIPKSIKKEIVKIFNLRTRKRITADEYFVENICKNFGEISKNWKVHIVNIKINFLKNKE